MTRISSKATFFQKRVFPVIWFGFLAFFVLIGISTGAGVGFVAFPIGMAVFGFFIMKKLVGDLVDEVFDCGDALLIKNRAEEELVPFTNIMNVSAPGFGNAPRITLRLITPGKFGDEISFIPEGGFSFNAFAKSPLAEELMLRAHNARTERAG